MLAVFALCSCSPSSHVNDAGADGGDTHDDGGPLTLESCFLGLAPTAGSPFVGTLSFESLDGSTRVRLARQPGERSAVGETWAYDLVRFGIEHNGEVECITNRAALMYNFGHHNWAETATAQGVGTYVISMRYDFLGDEARWIDTLQINEIAPMTLRATACDVTPLDVNHCLLRSFP